MELTHKLTYNNTATTIEEPVGFDSLKMTMSRHDYHGMGVESSVDNLTFYGNAYDIIMTAYEADIDSEISYSVQTDSNVVIYQGKVDLSTIKVSHADYKSVSAKVGEIGVKTTFNNRIDTDVDLDDPKTIDGSAVTAPDWRKLHIPPKHLLYTNISKQREDVKYTMGGGDSTNDYIYMSYFHGAHPSGTKQKIPYLFLPIGADDIVEFGGLTEVEMPYTTDDPTVVDPQYVSDEDHEEKYGLNTKVDLDIDIDFKIEVVANIQEEQPEVSMNAITFRVVATDNNGHQIKGEAVGAYKRKYNESSVYERKMAYYFHPVLHTEDFLDAGWSITYYLEMDCPTDLHPALHVTVFGGSYVKMQMYDKLGETNNHKVYANAILAHDALNVIAHSISENDLAVRSEWYRSPESKWEAGTIGGGACKALTNGYKIRGLYTTEDNKRNMPLSFKSLIENLSALDCIGWGFSTESGTTCVRVERWDWFYNNTTLLTLTNIAEMTREVYADRIPTELEIGYKKYATDEEYNAIDSPHGTRKFTSGIKAVSKSINKLCDFIADNYAIEETRRAAFQVSDAEETNYDASIFVLELLRAQRVNASYAIGNTAVSAHNVGNADEFINAKLTPRHMAARWRSYLFATNNTTPFKFTSGELNYKAVFGVVPTTYTEDGTTYNSLQSMATTNLQIEKDQLTHTPAIFKAEKITFTHPISLAQYNAIKANPYGLVSANGILGWILDFKYEFASGKADFTLIAKNTQ